MKHLVDLVKLDRLDNLIRRKATGCPEDLAKQLELSRSTLFEIISFLRIEMNAPIIYNKYSLSYEYEYPPKFYLGFERDRINLAEIQSISGGNENNNQIENSMESYNLDNRSENENIH